MQKKGLSTDDKNVMKVPIYKMRPGQFASTRYMQLALANNYIGEETFFPNVFKFMIDQMRGIRPEKLTVYWFGDVRGMDEDQQRKFGYIK